MLAEELNEAKLMNDLLDESDCYNESGSESIKELFGNSVFDNPKPVGLIKRLCLAANLGDGEIVLDFFAGSGTTAQAIAELNEADGGRRKFILVNIREETSKNSTARAAGYEHVSEITQARISKVMDKYPDFKLQGCRSLAIGESNFLESPEGLFENSPVLLSKTLKENSSESAIVMEILLKSGLDTTIEWQRIAMGKYTLILCAKTLIVLANPVTKELLENIYESDEFTSAVFLEDAFAGGDSLKANTFFNFKQINKIMRTI
jgi:adenine-specific DNA-methyltransferase